MKPDIKKLRRPILKITAALGSALIILLLVLRSVYAISIFNGLSAGMRQSGWDPGSDTDSVMQTGEGLTYEASYLFFKIGSVKMQVLGKTVYDGVPAYHIRANIDSYSGIPFVNLHAVYDTYQDANTFTCLFTSNMQKDGADTTYTTYHLDFEKKIIDWKLSKNGKEVEEVKVPLDKKYTDGLSFFYYLREASRKAGGTKTGLSIPIVVDTVRSKVDLTINEKKDECEVPAFDYPLQAYRMSGHIYFTGFFGVTGNFSGWMTADSSEVPLKANVSVIIGSVVVKLKEARRTGWIPLRSED
jgi:Protein of unknown function (DUF3108)